MEKWAQYHIFGLMLVLVHVYHQVSVTHFEKLEQHLQKPLLLPQFTTWINSILSGKRINIKTDFFMISGKHSRVLRQFI